MVLLVTSDNEQFVVDKEVAERSVLIKNMLEGKYTVPPRPVPHLTTRLTPRCWRERPANSTTQRLFVRTEKGSRFLCRPCRTTCRLIACKSHRFWSTASTIVASLCRPLMRPMRTRTESEQLTSGNGTKSLSQLIRRCCLRSSWPPTISISNLCCASLPAVHGSQT